MNSASLCILIGISASKTRTEKGEGFGGSMMKKKYSINAIPYGVDPCDTIFLKKIETFL